MENLQNFLKKFTKIDLPQRETREKVVELCKKILNKDIALSDVSIRQGVVYVNVPPLLKGELFMRKKEILEALNKHASDGSALYTDIR